MRDEIFKIIEKLCIHRLQMIIYYIYIKVYELLMVCNNSLPFFFCSCYATLTPQVFHE